MKKEWSKETQALIKKAEKDQEAYLDRATRLGREHGREVDASVLRIGDVTANFDSVAQALDLLSAYMDSLSGVYDAMLTEQEKRRKA